ncbi:AAA family ATPase [Saccharibacillus sp. CPCC 101409]|uniref:AAA family ATPase n=1 Tax=Saccharibacillus sp. CPCC 101409 TaxID=3058041 RepID=UPI002673A72E|nr:AAA family ATPase [Saccharibacillus sp. CPCC 101409]MDO3408384.1 AAA family ATPase [Saccharibacillus sp. CPCC 101409]
MLLESIKLFNFRQYYQEQCIEFSQSSTRNVTVIHGENGAGKTALLNAFIWCLYGTLNLPNGKNIINEHAISTTSENSEVEGSVTLKFTSNGKKYTLIRKVTAKKSPKDIFYYDPEVVLEYREDGQSEIIKNPTVEIGRILPEDLRSYFFFDGERIDNLSKESGSEDIKRAIKNIMGLEILERAISHTESARKKFRSDLKNVGDSKTANLIEEMEKLDQQMIDFQDQEELQKENLRATNKQIKEVEDRLKQIEGAKQLQELRDQKINQLEEIRGVIKDVRKKLTLLISKNGYLAFSHLVAQKAEKFIRSNKSQKPITGIKRHFIESLVENRTCICGAELTEGSSHWHHINNLMSKISNDQVENKTFDFMGDLKIITEKKKNLFSEMKQLKAEELSNLQEEKKLNEEIEEISLQLAGKDSEEIAELENRRIQLIEGKSEIDRKIGGITSKIEEITKQNKEKKDEQSKVDKIEIKAKLTQKRMDTCEQLEKAMLKILSIREKQVRIQLQDKISSVYSQFLRKDYTLKLSASYELNVLNSIGNIVGMSQGERQITSLSFIGAIVDIAREQFKKENKQGFDEGGIYPLVMDSPFGALDSDHRERIAKGIHKLADQVIVIVSTSQWKGEVENQMHTLIGKEYKLSYNDPRTSEQQYEFTKVEEVKWS